MKIKYNFVLYLGLVLSTMFAIGCSKKEDIIKNTLVFAQLSEPKSLDPQNSTDTYSQNAIAQIYDRLFEINEKNGEPIPSLVKSYEKIGNNKIKIKLNEKIRFHNGDFLTSEDVHFTIMERAKKNLRVAHLYKLIENINIIDNYTFEIITSEAFAPLMNHLSHKSSSILSKKEFEKLGEDKYFQNPVGTGAYKVKSWDLGDKITLEAVPNYFKGDAKIKNIIIKGVPEENSKVIGLETGELDMILDIPAISWESIENNPSLTYVKAPSTTTAYIGLNVKKGILQDKEVRQAIALSVDKDAIISAVFSGTVEKAEQFLAPPVFGYDSTVKAQKLDIEKAKKIIETKELVGTELKIIVSSPERVQLATILQDQLKNIGLNLKIELLEWGTFLAESGNGSSDMFILGWAPSTYDGDYGYYPNFHSNQFGSNGNRMFYSNEKVDFLLEMAKKEMDLEKRRGFYKEITTILIEDNPVIPLYHGNDVFGVSKKLKNVIASGYPEFYKYEFINE
ncbi:MAG: ABC transporter substrate-binding protein [Fusobacteriaceae bacterium]